MSHRVYHDMQSKDVDITLLCVDTLHPTSVKENAGFSLASDKGEGLSSNSSEVSFSFPQAQSLSQRLGEFLELSLTRDITSG